ncbi:nucleolar complex protein [Canna indica]|uniref:Nucleolar complex protein n=1 Tax=Canna indica TaxID=4628 RepID=A0AAQ3Q8G2_9LILI|nr:nucleolar complex protein [Canna indica]
MAKKLGKKARKFAKKNLQSVMKRKRKLNSMFKKKSTPRRGNTDSLEDSKKLKHVQQVQEDPKGLIAEADVFSHHLGDIFNEQEEDLVEDVSESDGYLSEDSECPYISGSEDENCSEEKRDSVLLQEPNREIHEELANQKSKLDELCVKDPKFSEFLESRRSDLHKSRSEEIYSDEEDASSMDEDSIQENRTSNGCKVLTSSTVDVWCWLVMEQPNASVLTNVINGFRAACHYGVGSDEVSPQKIADREVFSKILTFILHEADDIFRRLMGISGSLNKDNILKVTNKSEWKTMRPLIKSFLRSSLFLLNQESDSQILMFVLSRLRSSIMFFAAFPSLAKKLIKISVHLWATGDESLSACSFLVIRDIASKFPSDYLDICLTKTYGAFIANCKFMESASSKHIEFLENSIVEIYSLDIQRSYQKVFFSVQQLASILKQALKTKKKDELKMIHSWQYINCISIWVKFVCCNFKNYDTQPLLFLIIGVLRGVAHLFPGPRYLPLRFKCVKMLNHLSLSCGVFIPVASMLFDCLEHKGNINADRSQQKQIDLSLSLKVPKHLLKSRGFQEASILLAIQLLSEHFSQWCYHVSFPELATIPLILLKRFYESTTLESLRRPVKRLMDQVQQNSDFIQRKRDEASFSPKDEPSVDSFLQLEKCNKSASFSRFYASIQQTSISQKAAN